MGPFIALGTMDRVHSLALVTAKEIALWRLADVIFRRHSPRERPLL
jgi:hypothetical protein